MRRVALWLAAWAAVGRATAGEEALCQSAGEACEFEEVVTLQLRSPGSGGGLQEPVAAPYGGLAQVPDATFAYGDLVPVPALPPVYRGLATVPPLSPGHGGLLAGAPPRRPMLDGRPAPGGSSSLSLDSGRLLLLETWVAQNRSAEAAEAEVAESRRTLSLLQEQLEAHKHPERREPLAFLRDKASTMAAAAGSLVGQSHPHLGNPVRAIYKVMKTPTAGEAFVVLAFGCIVAIAFQIANKHADPPGTKNGSISARNTIYYPEEKDDMCCTAWTKSCANFCGHILCDCSKKSKILFGITVPAWWIGFGLLWNLQMMQPMMKQLAVALLFGSVIIMVVMMSLAETYLAVNDEVSSFFDFFKKMQKQVAILTGSLGFDDDDDDDDKTTKS